MAGCRAEGLGFRAYVACGLGLGLGVEGLGLYGLGPGGVNHM